MYFSSHFQFWSRQFVLLLFATATFNASAADVPKKSFFANPARGSWHSIALGTEFTSIQNLTLPAGSYILNANAVLTSSTPSATLIDCRFALNGVSTGLLASGTIGGNGATNQLMTLPLTYGFSASATRHVALECRAEFASIVFSQPSPITAVQVDELVVRGGLNL
jgi:hypothetical protein